jgi:phosphoglycerate dehydrogenase-like enzyme
MRVAVLDDWQGIARHYADWSELEKRAEIVFFADAFADEDAAAAALADFEIIIAMRERTAFPASLIARLPKLRFFNLTGKRGSTLDFPAFHARGVIVSTTAGADSSIATAELTLGLMMAAARQISKSEVALRRGDFQKGTEPGLVLSGRTLGLIGLGRIGGMMARYGTALGMTVIAWSPNLTQDRATPVGANAVSKADLLARADVVSIHMVLSATTRNLVGRADLIALKDGAILINTSRAGLIDQDALVTELHKGRIFAALDVYDREPLPLDHPLMGAPNTLLTPHLGYGSADVMRDFYVQSVENVLAFLNGAPIRVMPPDAK